MSAEATLDDMFGRNEGYAGGAVGVASGAGVGTTDGVSGHG